MKFDSHGGISIFELVVYFPALLVAIFVCSRHGFGRSSGWVFTLILCLVRIVGACCQLATYHSETKGLFEAVIILDSIGISPLLLATLGLLSRCADSIGNASSKLFHPIHFRLLQLLITLGLILCIVGGTNSYSSTGVYQPQTTTKAGVVLYVVAFIMLILLAVVLAAKSSNSPGGDKRIVWAVFLAIPFIAVRLIYSLISVFAHNPHFNLVTGSVVIHVFMSVIEEMLVVIIYLAVGLMVETITRADRGPIANRRWKGNLGGGAPRESQHGRKSREDGHEAITREDGNERVTGEHGNETRPIQGRNGRRSRQGGNGRRRQGPIHALVGMGMDAMQRNKQGGSEVRQA